MSDDAGAALLVLFMVWLFVMIPAWIAFLRGHPSRWAIAMFNAAFGWTGIGWIIALIWSLTATSHQVVIRDERRSNQRLEPRLIP